ncbi:hypothetical protein J27TS7_35340 [Paenibacillus dendritiformis]|nr:hypothetical protein J27TS7_35340 [Paenibacillus dendritiformis]
MPEKVAKEKLYSVVNNDTETISGVVNVLVFGLNQSGHPDLLFHLSGLH